jgi:hypothetical protein
MRNRVDTEVAEYMSVNANDTNAEENTLPMTELGKE